MGWWWNSHIIHNDIQGKNESVQAYIWRLKELICKLENELDDGLKKWWFIEGITPSLWENMKVVPPSSYKNASKFLMDIESENKISKGRNHGSENNRTKGEYGEEPKKIKALRRDVMWMMKLISIAKEGIKEGKEIWYTDYQMED